ncbi:hypothetical protein HanRHA438_Chr09g0390191 [Helianthus annuus]|nr:hypothetical protein HanIR_Chr09g0408131 [Helianthus annuus]KAJ0533416.1 hypothetical protein HanIR_Chr09g0408141 [Helianthus annuus]KAJ0887384.1 hypothetical protein HanRHA438_Chr09g0390181 [Helianthus annuus]KAJ0887385.1 hypothetical protein HanRHA438_Chr09g0390191 [Helianthus annuus]
MTRTSYTLTWSQRGPRKPCLCFTRAARGPRSDPIYRTHQISFQIVHSSILSLKF